MEASTSEEVPLSFKEKLEIFGNKNEEKKEVKNGNIPKLTAKFERSQTIITPPAPPPHHKSGAPGAPPLLPKPKVSDTLSNSNKVSLVKIPPKPTHLNLKPTQNENIPPPLKSAPYSNQNHVDHDVEVTEKFEFRQVIAKFNTEGICINGRTLETLKFKSNTNSEASQNGSNFTSEATSKTIVRNDSISDNESASDADEFSGDEDVTDNEDSRSNLSSLTRDTSEIQSPSSRPGSFAKNDTLHTSVLNEMRSRGLFKKLAAIGEHIPSDVGKVRDASAKREKSPRKSEPPYLSQIAALNLTNGIANGVKNHDIPQVQLRAAPPVPPHRTSDFSDAVSSAVSAHTSMTTTTSSTCSDRDSREDSLPVYAVGDEKENKRLRDLHGIAREFYIVQKTYVELLTNIAKNYPEYIKGCEENLQKPYKTLTITTYPGQKNILEYTCSMLDQILAVHKILLEEFEKVYQNWNSRNPDLAVILQRKADFLKICNQFLKEKPKLCEDLQKFLDEDKEFAVATKKFEDSILNSNPSTSNGPITCMRGISIVMHLDAVHQNVVRYKLLMERYRKLVPDSLLEANIADEALKKLTAVSNTVNGFLADADAPKKLLELYRKLQSFDVFAPGRRLLHEGELQRQTRKDLQPRYLILFSDTLLICRYSYGFDSFDPNSLYKIPTDRIRVDIKDHEDYEREFYIISPKKSSGFIAKSKLERDTWVSRLAEARIHMRELRRRKKSHQNLETRPKLGEIQKQNSAETPEIECKSIMEAPTPTSSRNFNSGRYEALWIPDNKATKCLMAGCDTKFSMIHRKHHCRQCGWLICRRCVGYAPVKIKNYESCKVCPQCFYEIKDSFEKGLLFPTNMIRLVGLSDNSESSQDSSRVSLDGSNIRIAYDGGSRLKRPEDLFYAPPSGPLKKIKNPLEKDENDEYIVSGRVQLRTKKGSEVIRWGRFSRDYNLDFFEAEFDDEPADKFFIYGYTLNVMENDDGSCVFEIFHRNQFQTDRKDDKIIFKVTHSKSAEKWTHTLKSMLAYEG